jgi:serine protease Do
VAASKFFLSQRLLQVLTMCFVGIPFWLQATLFTAPLSAETQTAPAELVSDSQAIEFLEQSVRETVQLATPATIGIGSGSGVVVSEEGLVFTVAHVATKIGSRLPVIFADGRRTTAVVLGRHEAFDAAVCQIVDKGPFKFVEVGNSETLQTSDWVIAMGYPVSFEKGQKPAVRVGRITAKQGSRNLVADCPIMGGDSGGPLLNLAGQLVGIGSRCRDATDTNYFVPEHIYRTHWEPMVSGEDLSNLRQGRKPGRPHRPVFEDGQQAIVSLPPYPRTGANFTALKIPPKDSEKTNRQVLARSPAAAQTIEQLQLSIFRGRHRIASGCRWQDDGLVITKASLIGDDRTGLRAIWGAETEVDLEYVGADEQEDLALFRVVDAKLSPLTVSACMESASVGSMVLSMNAGGEYTAGFIASEPRRFNLRSSESGKAKPLLGVRTQLIENRLTIVDIVDRSAAARAGLQAGDEVVGVNQHQVSRPEELNRLIASYSPGDRITVEVRREDSAKEVRVKLGTQTSGASRSSIDQWGGGPFSVRRFGFEHVLTHDTTLSPESCGGPLVNAKGQLVGINISRALRVATYALTADRVNLIVARLLEDSATR